MKVRLAKKLRDEMLSWTRESKVRHSLNQFKRSWKVELRCAFRGHRWAVPVDKHACGLVILGLERVS